MDKVLAQPTDNETIAALRRMPPDERRVATLALFEKLIAKRDAEIKALRAEAEALRARAATLGLPTEPGSVGAANSARRAVAHARRVIFRAKREASLRLVYRRTLQLHTRCPRSSRRARTVARRAAKASTADPEGSSEPDSSQRLLISEVAL